jgi:hypothetical protein
LVFPATRGPAQSDGAGIRLGGEKTVTSEDGGVSFKLRLTGSTPGKATFFNFCNEFNKDTYFPRTGEGEGQCEPGQHPIRIKAPFVCKLKSNDQVFYAPVNGACEGGTERAPELLIKDSRTLEAFSKKLAFGNKQQRECLLRQVELLGDALKADLALAHFLKGKRVEVAFTVGEGEKGLDFDAAKGVLTLQFPMGKGCDHGKLHSAQDISFAMAAYSQKAVQFSLSGASGRTAGYRRCGSTRVRLRCRCGS